MGFLKYGNSGYEQCQAGIWSWNNCWFWVFEKKQAECKNCLGFGISRRSKEPPGFMKERVIFLFPKNWEPWLYVRTESVWCFENHRCIKTKYLKIWEPWLSTWEPPWYLEGFGAVTNNCPTLVMRLRGDAQLCTILICQNWMCCISAVMRCNKVWLPLIWAIAFRRSLFVFSG